MAAQLVQHKHNAALSSVYSVSGTTSTHNKTAISGIVILHACCLDRVWSKMFSFSLLSFPCSASSELSRSFLSPAETLYSKASHNVPLPTSTSKKVEHYLAFIHSEIPKLARCPLTLLRLLRPFIR